jgi:hypothetical protein
MRKRRRADRHIPAFIDGAALARLSAPDFNDRAAPLFAAFDALDEEQEALDARRNLLDVQLFELVTGCFEERPDKQ